MFERKDHYWKQAKQKGYRSRAAYKLIEIQKRFQIFKKGDYVLDLGCAPGGWVQVVAPQVGTKGKVIGLDRLPVKAFSFPHVVLVKGDIEDVEQKERIQGLFAGPVRVVISDLSPDLTGIHFQDHCRSCELVRTAFLYSQGLLSPGGIFLAKIFQGEELESVFQQLKEHFQQVKRVVPTASRKASSEIYLLARGFRP